MMEKLLMLPMLIAILAVAPLRQALFPNPSTASAHPLKKRSQKGDILKGIAILGVIGIHVGHVFLVAHGQHNDTIFLYTVNNLLRFSLPFFFILSGIFLSLHSSSLSDIAHFYWRKIVRIFVPFALCTAIIAEAAGVSLRELGMLLLNGQALTPYYFVVILFQLYVLYPFLQPLRSSRRTLVLTFIFSFFCYLFLPIDIVGIPFFGRFLFFFFYGMYMCDAFLSNKVGDTQSWTAIAFLYVFIMIAGFFISPSLNLFFNVRFFFGLAMFHILWACIPYIKKEPWIARIAERCGRYSLWMYLLHYLVIVYLYQFGLVIQLSYYVLYVSLLFVVPVISYGFARLADAVYSRITPYLYVSKKKA